MIPSYLIAVMTSSLWLLPDLPVNRDEENRYWLKTCLLLRMHFVKGHLDSADSKWPTIQVLGNYVKSISLSLVVNWLAFVRPIDAHDTYRPEYRPGRVLERE